MTYQATADLSLDAEFAQRLGAALTKEALAKPSDHLVDQILKSPGVGQAWFMPMVSGAPGFDDAYSGGGQAAVTDGMLLAAIQASWPRVFELYDQEGATS